jgi:predicted nucleic-acid-binding protein
VAIAIDSSVLVRYFTQDDDKLFAEASRLLTNAKPNSLVLDRVIIAEFGYVLRSVYGLKKDRLVPVYKSMLANDIFAIPDRELVEGTISIFDKEKPLSFEDCWLLSLKRSKKVTNVFTFDDGLLKRLNAV